VTHNGQLTLEQRLWVVLLAAPRGAVLGGLTAAALDGFQGFPPADITVVLPASSYRPRIELPEASAVQVRWSRMLSEDDVNLSVTPPRTRRARSIVNAASERVPERRARVLVLAAVQQGFVRPSDLSGVVARLGTCRNRHIIVEAVRDAEGGIASLPEHEFEIIRRRLNLPPSLRQQVHRRPDGRYYLDNDWPDFGVRVEIHGIPHLEVRNWDNDLLRQNDLSIEGGGLLIFSSYAIRHAQLRVEEQLERMFTLRGWRSSPRHAR
jgi:hypothetical protein